MDTRIEYEDNKYLEFEAGPVNFFLGSNSDIKWKLFRGLERFNLGKTLNELEENVYGEDGISIEYQERKLKNRDLNIFILDSRQSLLQQLTLSKESLLIKYFEDLHDDFKINQAIYELNDKLLKLEVMFQERVKADLQSLTPEMRSIEFDEILKKFLKINYNENEKPFPLQMLDINQSWKDYCKLLNNYVSSENKQVWLWIKNPNSFINKESLKKFVDNLREIAQKNELLKIFIVSEDYLDLNYKLEDVGNTVVIYDDFQQLPPYKLLLESISKNYPDNKLENSVLEIKNLFRIFPYIGNKDLKNIFLNKKNMIILKLMEQLLGCDEVSWLDSDEDKLTICERNFLYG